MSVLGLDKMTIAAVLSAVLALAMTLPVFMPGPVDRCFGFEGDSQTDQRVKSGRGTPEDSNRNQMNSGMAWSRLCSHFPDIREDKPIKVPLAVAERFAGFVEGLTRAKLPRWWEEALFSARGHSKNGIYFRRPKSWPYHIGGRVNLRSVEGEINLPRTVSCVKKDDFSALKKNGTIVRVPKGVYAVFPPDNINLSLNGDTYYIAPHSDFSTKYPLFCVNRTTSKIMWKTDIRPDNGGTRGFSGSWWHCIEIIPQENRVIVFGAVCDALYVVGLNSETGKQLFRFSSYGAAERPPSK